MTALYRDVQAAGERKFQQLVSTHQRRVFNICYSLLKNRQDADDAAQEVFIKIYRSLATLPEAERAPAWIYRIAVRASLDQLRHRHRQKRWAPLVRISDSPPLAEQLAAPESLRPDVNLENSERMTILWQEIDRLAEKQRTALILHKLQGFSHQEIAAMMDTTVPAIESLLHRAQANLHKRLLSYYEDHLS